MRPTNLLFLLSDQHTRAGLGCYGGPGVTPNLDALAARGSRFTAAYTNCPICVPARASLATGRYVHEIGFWDNGIPSTTCSGSISAPKPLSSAALRKCSLPIESTVTPSARRWWPQLGTLPS